MSQPQSVTDARGYGDDVLQSSAQLHSRYIVVCINSKRGIAEFALHGLCQSRIFRRNCDRGRITACDFLGERWSAERANPRLKSPIPADHLRNDIAHPQQAVVFKPLGSAHKLLLHEPKAEPGVCACARAQWKELCPTPRLR